MTPLEPFWNRTVTCTSSFSGPVNGVDLFGKAARPPAQRVDEVAAFAGEPRSLQRVVPVPAVGGQRPRADQVAGHRARARRAEL